MLHSVCFLKDKRMQVFFEKDTIQSTIFNDPFTILKKKLEAESVLQQTNIPAVAEI